MTRHLKSAIGAISGTSMDGIDVALIRTDGLRQVEIGAGRTLPYPSALRSRLLALLADPDMAERDPLADLDQEVSEAFADAIATFMSEAAVDPATVDLVGLHGQTILHRPERGVTRQLGRGRLVAQRLGLHVVDAFRQADVAAGGQGAPFAPLYHAALAASLEPPLLVLNLGGVGNVTFIDGETVIAFDTGPASALIDDLVLTRFGLPYDAGGAIAARGKVDLEILAELMRNPFFDEKPPKSLDRQDFHARARIVERLADADAVATLAAFTVEATAAAFRHLPRAPRRVVVCGGGRHNASLMAGLARRLAIPVEPAEIAGWNGDLIEAQCFAYLAVRSVQKLPLSLPTTTGVPHPLTGGVLWAA